MATTSEPERNRLYVVNLRKRLGLRQTDMANALGMSLPAYNAMEIGHSKCRKVHVLAVERVSLSHAMLTGDRSLVAPTIAKDIAVGWADRAL